MSNISKIKIKNADGTEKEYHVSDSNIVPKIGNLEELVTKDKSNLVNAINEVSENGSKNNFVDCTLAEYNAMETHDPDTYYNVIDDVQDTSSILHQIGDITQLNTEEKSNLVNAINEVKASASGGDKTIDGIPVDLTGIYNTQVIGYDETQGKLVPMINVARTEIIIPSNETPSIWKIDSQNNIDIAITGTNGVAVKFLNSNASSFIVSSVRPYMLSEYTDLYLTSNGSNNYTTSMVGNVLLEFSKNADFSTIDATFSLGIHYGNNMKYNNNISALKGFYYIRFYGDFSSTNASGDWTYNSMKFSQGGTT